MVIRDYVKCINCNHEYRIRYNVGNKFPQSAMFPCKTCGENLTYGFEKDKSKILGNIDTIDVNLELPSINLHPELPIDPEFESDPHYFPSLNFVVQQMKKGESGLPELRKIQRSLGSYIEHWDKIQQDFRYLTEQRWHMLESKYGKNKEKTERKILKEILYTARFYLDGKEWCDLYRNTLAECEKAKHHSNFSKLKEFLINYKSDFLLQKMYSSMKKYRDVETELLPTLLSQKCGIAQKGLSSSPNWEKIQKVYGDFYELYGDLLLIPTTINNLNIRGDFEKFATNGFTIAKYEDTDKAGRSTNFLNNDKLKALGDFYSPSIRNSTHHEASSFEIEEQNIVMKTGKGGKIEKKIPLLDYIIHCNEIYARCLILFNMMYKIVF